LTDSCLTQFRRKKEWHCGRLW